MRTTALVFSLVLTVSASASMQQGRAGGAAPAGPRPPSNDTIATLLSAAKIKGITEGGPTQERIIVERLGVWRLAVEHRRLPQRPALHENEGEVWAVIEGTGTIRTGGKIEGAAAPTAGTATQAPGNVFGKTIVGGTDHQVGPGDFLLIPENVPHEIVAASSTLKLIVFEVTRQR